MVLFKLGREADAAAIKESCATPARSNMEIQEYLPNPPENPFQSKLTEL